MTVRDHFVGTLIARSAAALEHPAARLRLEHLVGYAELTPRALAPRAVLVVRRAAASYPIAFGRTHLGGRWEREVRGHLAEQLRRAERPECGRIAVRAEAVVFEDVTEWLACFSVAAAVGDLGAVWLWRGLTEALGAASSSRSALAPRDLPTIWRSNPLVVPFVAARLCHWGRAAEVLRPFAPGECEAICSALSADWGLDTDAWRRPGAQRSFKGTDGDSQASAGQGAERSASHSSFVVKGEGKASALVTGADSAVGGDTTRGRFDDELDQSNNADRRLRPRGRTDAAGAGGFAQAVAKSAKPMPALLREALAGGGLSPEAERLLAVSLALCERPTWARSNGFAAEVSAWLAEAHGARGLELTRFAASRLESLSRRFIATGRAAHEADLSAAVETPAAKNVRGGARASVASEAHASTGRPSVERVGNDATKGESAAAANTERRALDIRDEAGADGEAVEDDEHEAKRRRLGAAEFETRLGGAFYLLNLFSFVGLPECFDEELRLSEHLSGWGLTELFARWLLASESRESVKRATSGESLAALSEDGLWEMLARLEGRACGAPPAAEFCCGPAYRMPARWLARFVASAGEIEISESGANFCAVSRQGGFIVAEEPRAGRTPAEFAESISRLFAPGSVRVVIDEPVATTNAAELLTEDVARVWPEANEALRWWMSRIFPFLRYLLARLIGAEGLKRDALARMLLLRPSVVYISGMHVDLVMSLERVSLEVRRAGLDASPGWSRDLARVVTFHYQ